MSDAEGVSLFSRPPKQKRQRVAPAASLAVKEDEEEQRVAAAEAPLEPAEPAAAGSSEQPPAQEAAEEGEVTFRQLGLSEWLDRVCGSLGVRQPTQVQRGTIPAVLAGRNVIGVAHTGSGKTAAFALPILQKLAKDPFGVFALVLTPTRQAAVPRAACRRCTVSPAASVGCRLLLGAACNAQDSHPPLPLRPLSHPAPCRELAFQLADQFRALGAGMSLKECVVVGGLDMQQQAKELSRRPHVVVATPGRLRDLIQQDADLARAFGRTRFLVLDEADRLLEPSFESELAVVLRTLPEARQTLLFSATMTKTLIELQSQLLQDAYHFQVGAGGRWLMPASACGCW